MVDLVEQLLRDHRAIRPIDARLQSSWRLKRHLDADLQQTDGEARRDLARDPQAKGLINLLCLQDHIFQLVHVADTQVGVLQDHPASREECCVVLLSGHLLLTFAHGDLVRGVLLLLLRQLVDGEGRVAPCGQQVQHRLPARGLVVDVCDGVRDGRGEARVEHGLDELGAGDARAVLAHEARDAEPQEGAERAVHDESVLVVRHGAALGLVLVEPLLPVLLVALDLVNNLAVEQNLVRAKGMAGNLQEIQPDLVRHPLERVRPLGLHVQRRARLQEDSQIRTRELSCNNHDLHSDHQLEHHLIALEQTPVGIAVDLVGQEVDDLVHPLRRWLALLRVPDRDIELLLELQKRAIVHPPARLGRDRVNHIGHVDHVEVHDTASRGHGSELLPLLVDLDLALVRLLELAGDLLRLRFCVSQDLHKLFVLSQVAL
mmetsp:Transcript_78729/g.197787  ORF Transcript_78729/g.197787 Transcript_78729/m.197787 type:complete len:431 (-) Transcript_78729:5505-6797(-)